MSGQGNAAPAPPGDAAASGEGRIFYVNAPPPDLRPGDRVVYLQAPESAAPAPTGAAAAPVKGMGAGATCGAIALIMVLVAIPIALVAPQLPALAMLAWVVGAVILALVAVTLRGGAIPGAIALAVGIMEAVIALGAFRL